MNKLKFVVDKKNYHKFKGADWPSYESFIAGDYKMPEHIKQEIDEFVSIMDEKYEDLTNPKIKELSLANQMRQNQTFYNKKYQGEKCHVPWTTLGVNVNGNVFICESPSWIPIFVGNILETSTIYDILNNNESKKIRQEILAGRYFYCNSSICNFFKDKTLGNTNNDSDDLRSLDLVDNENLYVRQIPTNLIFDFDYTCNFKCPSCRTEYQNYNNDPIVRTTNNNILEKIKKLIIDQINDQPIVIRWCGGEPFISESYIELFDYIVSTNKKNISHVVQTNGSVLKSKSSLLENFLPYIQDLRISFDAATEETYKKVRVGGNWNNLIENVKFVKQLIEINNFETKISADFVVQLDNYKEIPKFVELCKTIGIKNYNLQKMWNWGTWDKETFMQKNVYDQNHVLYTDLQKYLAALDEYHE